MKKRKKFQNICIIIPILFLTLFIFKQTKAIPSTIFIKEGQQLKYDNIVTVMRKDNESDKAIVNLFGVVPVKSVSVKCVPDKIYLYPGGRPVGVKLNTKGVLVVALSDIQTEEGITNSPAATSGVEIGDSIIKVNDKNILNAEQLGREVEYSEGKEINICIERKGTIVNKTLKPIKSSKDNKYKIGLWVRDSTAGVGTLTFYDDKTKKFAALGHPITDVDTGTILSINSGQIVSSSIISTRKGIKGSPGELKGIFVDEDLILGNISKNTECGIFGKSLVKLTTKGFDKPMEIALRHEIKEGPAKIITTVEGSEPKLYDIVIEKLLPQDSPGSKSMVIRITDSKLLEKTGGIVQGMSGSPIIQDGKIVGAVTHVLINKPEVGYGIYIEWMLRDAKILTE